MLYMFYTYFLNQLIRCEGRISLVEVMTNPWVKEGMAIRNAQLQQQKNERGKENLARN